MSDKDKTSFLDEEAEKIKRMRGSPPSSPGGGTGRMSGSLGVGHIMGKGNLMGKAFAKMNKIREEEKTNHVPQPVEQRQLKVDQKVDQVAVVDHPSAQPKVDEKTKEFDQPKVDQVDHQGKAAEQLIVDEKSPSAAVASTDPSLKHRQPKVDVVDHFRTKSQQPLVDQNDDKSNKTGNQLKTAKGLVDQVVKVDHKTEQLLVDDKVAVELTKSAPNLGSKAPNSGQSLVDHNRQLKVDLVDNVTVQSKVDQTTDRDQLKVDQVDHNVPRAVEQVSIGKANLTSEVSTSHKNNTEDKEQASNQTSREVLVDDVKDRAELIKVAATQASQTIIDPLKEQSAPTRSVSFEQTRDDQKKNHYVTQAETNNKPKLTSTKSIVDEYLKKSSIAELPNLPEWEEAVETKSSSPSRTLSASEIKPSDTLDHGLDFERNLSSTNPSTSTTQRSTKPTDKVAHVDQVDHKNGQLNRQPQIDDKVDQIDGRNGLYIDEDPVSIRLKISSMIGRERELFIAIMRIASAANSYQVELTSRQILEIIGEQDFSRENARRKAYPITVRLQKKGLIAKPDIKEKANTKALYIIIPKLVYSTYVAMLGSGNIIVHERKVATIDGQLNGQLEDSRYRHINNNSILSRTDEGLKIAWFLDLDFSPVKLILNPERINFGVRQGVEKFLTKDQAQDFIDRYPQFLLSQNKQEIKNHVSFFCAELVSYYSSKETPKQSRVLEFKTTQEEKEFKQWMDAERQSTFDAERVRQMKMIQEQETIKNKVREFAVKWISTASDTEKEAYVKKTAFYSQNLDLWNSVIIEAVVKEQSGGVL